MNYEALIAIASGLLFGYVAFAIHLSKDKYWLYLASFGLLFLCVLRIGSGFIKLFAS